jgi:hypothetical protein
MPSYYDSLSGTMQTTQSADALIQSLVQERNALRTQNDQLWKVIEQQRQQLATFIPDSSNPSISGKWPNRTSQHLPNIHSRQSSSSSLSISPGKSASQPGYLPGIQNGTPPELNSGSLPVVKVCARGFN